MVVKKMDEKDCAIIDSKSIIAKVRTLVYDDNGKCKNDESTYQYMNGCYIKSTVDKNLKNHLWFNGFLWRIIGIDEVKIITEENVTSIPYAETTGDVTFTTSYANKWLNEYFYNSLDTNLSKLIMKTKFCQGAHVANFSPARTNCDGGTIL